MRGFIIGIVWGAVVAGLAAASLSLVIGFPDARVTATADDLTVAKPEAVSAALPAEAPSAVTDLADPSRDEAAAVGEAAVELADPFAAPPAPTSVAQGQAEIAFAAIPEAEPELQTLPSNEAAVTRPASSTLVAPGVSDPIAADTAPLQTPEVVMSEATTGPGQSPTAPVVAVPSLPGRIDDATITRGPETGRDLEAAMPLQVETADVDTASLASPDVGTVPEGLNLGAVLGQSLASTPGQEVPPLPPTQPALPRMPEREADVEAETAAAVVPVQPQTQVLQGDADAASGGADASVSVTGSIGAPDSAATPVPDVIAALPERRAEGSGPLIGRFAGSLIDRPSAVPERRLPSIGSAVSEDATASDGAARTDVGRGSGIDPLSRFAATVEVQEGKPRISIVLIDDGSSPIGPSMLDGFPFPLAVAIDPSHPSAASAARGYRLAGLEILALADVPEGAQPSDVEIALAGALDAVPEAIGILEDPDGGLQASRAISTQVTSFLVESGHGLLTLPKGLNTAQQLAARDGVPSATLFRDFDGEGQNDAAMRRFLQSGAMRARQEGAVVMLGRLKADTISALIQWALQDSMEDLSLVPVSVVLREAIQP
jgi:hypothetical protein